MVTQNLLGHHMDRPRRLPAAADWFRRLDPDVVTLQETVVTGGYDQATEVLGDEYERGRQAVLTARFVEELVERTGQHVVLAGDMDAIPDADSIRFLRGVQALDGTSVSHRDAWELTHGTEPGPTFAPSLVPIVDEHWRTDLDRRIDHVCVRCGRAGPTPRVTECARTFDAPADGVSRNDHCGVVADLDLAG